MGFGEDGDATVAAIGDFAFRVDFIGGANDSLRQLGAHALYLAQLAGRGGQRRPWIAETVQQAAANPRPHAVYKGKADRINQLGVVVGHGRRGLGLTGLAPTPSNIVCSR